MSISRKRKKELRRLQNEANQLWENQQILVGHAADVAREAGRQLGNFGREQVGPAVQDTYNRRVVPVLDQGARLGRHVVDDKVVPIVGGVVGSALTAWDLANAKRSGLEKNVRTATKNVRKSVQPQKQGPGLGSVIAVILGVAAAVGVLYTAWQALRADDELWVADDPLSAPDA
ncbi:DNA helicase [Microbacterium sp. NPDC089695]|uniref:DNA helicase n=1 Tax=Microbacterium sp. NPDC089695 TaxID=3364198 RepID=UPI0037F22CCC